jgi:ligand-binding sensor domain-containing protein
MCRSFLGLVLILPLGGCSGQVEEPAGGVGHDGVLNPQPASLPSTTTFPQIHANLQGMVHEFVRTMHQDQRGHLWFGTNGDGIIRYNGQQLEAMVIEGASPNMRVLDILEDPSGHLWFGTSEGLIKYDGNAFKRWSQQKDGRTEEIWSLALDRTGTLWVGSTGGVYQFAQGQFIPFALPTTTVANARPMLSSQAVFKIAEDHNGTLWFATDGNGIFQYKQGSFTHLTTLNGLADNNTADLLEDQHGHMWIGSFYGGVSRWDGTAFTHFTQEGLIQGPEAYNLYEDRHGNLWFTAEGFGVYRYDGKRFQQFTTEDGLTSNVTLSILEDHKGQLWFGSWQGLSIYDGQTFRDAQELEPWTR